ncbi:glycosyltransferase [Motilibacter aurantiacus]|uniref:glycosyltransferase n=1 Tax=Motilibacter aurantiacus TaxID=2714955 RepID=UPI0014085590|nr:glycosyltransferase family 2 protein [Motilibacter aurantiacus]NHC44730.1 glycosyltransferase family 2 protein [Motilibacter aurantiacus]
MPAVDDLVAPDLTVVVPTRNEADNVGPLLARLSAALPGRAVEVLFVDDSDDETPTRILEQSRRDDLDVRLLHRPEGERRGGLSGAVVAGLRAARADWAVVMDGDLQHPPEVLPLLLEAGADGADVVVASRYFGDGSAAGLAGARRALVSGLSTRMAAGMFPRRLQPVSDPMSGFFAVRRGAVDLDRLRPRGYKILLELVLRTPGLRISEVPFTFEARRAGESKASLREGLRFLWQLVLLRLAAVTVLAGGLKQVGGFLAVGLSGIVVNTLALTALTAAAPALPYQAASAVATQAAIVWNFVLADRFVFSGAQRRSSERFGRFWALNTGLIPLQVLILTALVDGVGLHHAPANVVMLGLVFVLRYVVSARWVFPAAGTQSTGGRHFAARSTPPARPVAQWERPLTRAALLVVASTAAFAQGALALPEGSLGWLVAAAWAPLAAVLAGLGARRGNEIEDLQLDLIVAVVLLGSAVLLAAHREDGSGAGPVAALPVFSAGLVTLLFGVRALWRAWLPLTVGALTASPLGQAAWDAAGPAHSVAEVGLGSVLVAALAALPLVTSSPGPAREAVALGKGGPGATVALAAVSAAAVAAVVAL